MAMAMPTSTPHITITWVPLNISAKAHIASQACMHLRVFEFGMFGLVFDNESDFYAPVNQIYLSNRQRTTGNKPYPIAPAIYSVAALTMCSLYYSRIRKFSNDIKIYLLINYVKCAPIFICIRACTCECARPRNTEKCMVSLYRTIFTMFWTFNFTYNSYKSYYVRVSIKHEAWENVYIYIVHTHTHSFMVCVGYNT